MCGRFTIINELSSFQQILGLGRIPSGWTPRYNIAPGQNIPTIQNPKDRSVNLFHWGLIPSWAKDKQMGSKLINARAETIQEKPSFRYAFKQRRCLILADGFYEWQQQITSAAPKVPFLFILKRTQPFFFAGLWETWHDDTEEIQSCSIITCPANELIREVHHRMPVILDKESGWDWLEYLPAQALLNMLKPYPAEKMTGYPVSQRVNNPDLDDAHMIEPLPFFN